MKIVIEEDVIERVDVCVFCLCEQLNNTSCCGEVRFGNGCILNTGEVVLEGECVFVNKLPVGASNVRLSD